MRKGMYLLVIYLIITLMGCESEKVEGKTLAELNKEKVEDVDRKYDSSDNQGEKETAESFSTLGNTKEDNPEKLKKKESEKVVAKETKTKNNTKANNNSKLSKVTDHVIAWGEFFDEGDQTRPSEKFKKINGEQVSIKGWMGEVLNLGKGWFLLISEPGGECPFCADDESYWNEIMIIFVDDPNNLRYTKEPLLVEGRLDVGIKVDESNYKTMFRLYDATFTPI